VRYGEWLPIAAAAYLVGLAAASAFARVRPQQDRASPESTRVPGPP